MAKELLYTEKDKKLFLIVGYDNPMGADDLIKTLENGKKKLLSTLGKKVKKTKVYTDMITQSRRYKSMRVFFMDVEPKDVPKEAYFIEIKKEYDGKKIGLDSPYQWDMNKWLND
jgi:hypothetical protein